MQVPGVSLSFQGPAEIKTVKMFNNFNFKKDPLNYYTCKWPRRLY